MKPLKIGVIGTGHMGRNHVRNIAEETKYFDFCGIYDKDEDAAQKIAELYNTKTFQDMEQLLNAVDAAVIAVPSSLHEEVGLKAAEHGVHALIEKPLATTSNAARVLSNAFQERGLKLQVGHIERFNPVITELEKVYNSSKTFYIEAHRYSPFSGSGRITDTSVVEDLMIHDIELVCHLMKRFDVTEVIGAGERVRSNMLDFATCLLRFGEHGHAVVNASRVSQNKERAITIHTEDRDIHADLLNRTLTVTKNTDLILNGEGDGNSYTQDGIVQKIFVPIQEPLRAELISFYHAVVEDKPTMVDGETGIQAIRICEEVVRQASR